jgi:hypothetical protein
MLTNCLTLTLDEIKVENEKLKQKFESMKLDVTTNVKHAFETGQVIGTLSRHASQLRQ